MVHRHALGYAVEVVPLFRAVKLDFLPRLWCGIDRRADNTHPDLGFS